MFKLMALPYSTKALQPYLSYYEVSEHYDFHHRGYVDKLNELTKGTKYADMTLTQVIKEAPKGPLFNNAAQVYNHNFYWMSLSPKKNYGTLPILDAIGNIDKFKNQCAEEAKKFFGSGWFWVCKDGKEICCKTTKDAEPVMRNALFCLDLWEHSYLYQVEYAHDRAKYFDSVWNIIDWNFVNTNYLLNKG